MRPTWLVPSLLLALSVPASAEAQIGPFLEWINSLTGPGMVRVGPEVTVVRFDERSRVTLGALFAVHVDDRDNADTDAADIENFGFPLVYERTLTGGARSTGLRARLGVELHRFSGNFDSFWTWSVPVLASVHVPAGGWAFRVGTGAQIFHFPDDAFLPWDVGVKRDGFEAGWIVQVGVEFGDFAIFR